MNAEQLELLDGLEQKLWGYNLSSTDVSLSWSYSRSQGTTVETVHVRYDGKGEESL